MDQQQVTTELSGEPLDGDFALTGVRVKAFVYLKQAA